MTVKLAVYKSFHCPTPLPCKDTADIELDLDFNFKVQTEVMIDHVYLWRNF